MAQAPASVTYLHSVILTMTTSTVVISEPEQGEFAELTTWLRKVTSGASSAGQSLRSYPDITTALVGIQDPSRQPDLTVVLQSWSDQYIPADVDRLIGAIPASDLLCIYGAWCEGDGRSRPVWPRAVRVPLRHAQSAIETSLLRIRQGVPPLPPTASRDEAFLVRQPTLPAQRSQSTDPDSRGTALVVSPDRVLRETWANLLRLCGWNADDSSLEQIHRIASGRFDLIVHDLDPADACVTESLQRCRTAFETSRIVGIASLPGDVSHARLGGAAPFVLPKMDPLRSIGQLLRDAA